MFERNEPGASEMLAPAHGIESARIREDVSESQSDVFVSLKMPVEESRATEDSPVTTTLGTIEIIQDLSECLSTVITQGKAALMQKESIGFLQPGFAGLSIRALVINIEEAIEECHGIGENAMYPIPERVAAVSFAEVLLDFQYCLFGLDFDSLGRSDTRALLPALEKLKQVCLKAELELMMDLAKAAQAS